MDETTTTIPSGTDDGTQLFVYRWSPEGEPTAIVQVAHGMGEHAARYRRFAEALTGAGFVVYADDHRGHGRTATAPEAYGQLGEGGWSALVDDLGTVGAFARSEHPGLPLVLFGHSMGSFAAQQYALDHSGDIDALVLSGTSACDVVVAQLDPEAETDLSAFNEPFPFRTGYEWLSRDEAEVDAYVADPACGFGLDATATGQMIAGLPQTGDPQRLAGVRSDLPILVVSGSDDPLAGGGQLVELVGQRYRDAGVQDVTVTVYPQARHEILNETNRDEVTDDVLAFAVRSTLDR